MTTNAARTLALVRRHGVLRPRDLDRHHIARIYLQRLRDSGELRQVGRGLYTLASTEPSQHGSIAAVARRAPAAVVCLLSALRIHELTTQMPFETWIAIAAKARRPHIAGLPTRIVRMSATALTSGVEHRDVDGVPVAVFNIEKTVVDCFRFRNKIGLDVALEAMREYLRRRRKNIDRLMRYADIVRVGRIMLPYLEAMV